MLGRNSFIAEIAIDFKHTIQATDHQTFQVKFRRDAQIKILTQGIDIDDDTANYTAVYETWAPYMITEPSLLEEIKNAGSGGDTPSGNQPDDANTAREQKMQSLLQSLFDAIVDNQDKCYNQISAKIQNLGKYSPKSQAEFLKLLHDEFTSFTTSVQAEKTFAKNDYFNFLSNQNPEFNDDSLSQSDRDFLQSVDYITKDAIACQRAFMLDATSQAVKKNMITQLNQAMTIAELENAQKYQAQLSANEQELDHAWWTDVKGSGQDLLKDFSTEFKAELARQTQKAIARHFGEIGKEIGRQIIAPISAAVQQQLANLSTTLRTEDIELFLKDLTPAVRLLKGVIRVTNSVSLPKNLPINVTIDSDLSAQEQNFVSNRLAKIQPVLQQEFGISQPLRMAFCCSGGGNRAMIGTMGILQAAARSKILQASMYLAGLSGSTWVIAPWSYLYLNNKLNQDFEVSLQQIVQNWITTLNNPNMILTTNGIYTPASLTGQQAKDFAHQLAVRLGYYEWVSAVDLYGAMVGNIVLDLAGADKLKVTWSSIAQQLQNADIPMPLCSAVFDTDFTVDAKGKGRTRYSWFEISPFQVGGTEIGYIPPHYLGSTFMQGTLDTSAGQLRPEYSLSFLLGVCGSAFSLSLNDLVDHTLPSVAFNVDNNTITLPIDTWVRELLDESINTDVRGERIDMLHARFANFSVDMPESVLQAENDFGLFDAGIDFAFPLPVLLDRTARNVDLIFMYDSHPVDLSALKNMAKYYQRNKQIQVPDFSKVTTKALMAKAMTVFNDPRKVGYQVQQPTILYFPTRGFDIKKSPYITSNFKYTQAQMEQLMNATDEAFTSQLPEIKKIMQLVAQARRG